MAVPADTRSFAELLSNAVNQLTALMRNEVQLARAELSAKISMAAVGLAMILGSVAVFIAALVLILMALAAWLVESGFSSSLANLLAGVLGGVIAAAFAWSGINRLKAENLTPRRTLDQLHRDALAAKEIVK
jgi:uncharacterized membrane protein YqjE